jgi:inosine-uridine nucleoside N-ribohydrolase
MMKPIFILLLSTFMQSYIHGQIPILLDTDANNELDDQHAIAYLLFNSDVFNVVGITVNATSSGGDISQHMAEAKRVVSMCGYQNEIKIIQGASADFKQILPNISKSDFDGKPAVDFIIQSAHENERGKLVVVPIGSLTNVALALEKDPSIASLIRVVWLGSNWPDPGEYNLVNDTTAVNPVIDNRQLEFEICTVRYGEPSGTAAVDVSVSDIKQKMAGLGVQVDKPVAGRHGGQFTNFGDYSVELFIKYGDEVRPLFDVCALAIIKDPRWAKPIKVPAPKLVGEAWFERPDNSHHVIFWEYFDKEAIFKDFYDTMENPAKSN